MPSLYVQRQFNGFLGIGETTSAVQVSLPDTAWQSYDVNPSVILKIEPGLFSETTTTIDAALSETHTVALPSGYSSTKRLSFTLKTDQNLRITLTSPDHPASTVLVYAPEDGQGFYSVVETVTAISIVNIAASDATVEYVCFEYPDLAIPASWQGGVQTIGTVST